MLREAGLAVADEVIAERGDAETRAAAIYTSLSLHEPGPLAKTFERLIDGVLASLAAEVGSVLIVEPDLRMRVLAARGLPAEVRRSTCLEVGSGISGYVALTGEGLLVRDVECDDRFRRRNREHYFTHSFVSAPLVHERAVRGVINVSNRRDRRAFECGDLALLESVGRRASEILTRVDPVDWCTAGSSCTGAHIGD